ncbi:MAG TPA: hypothetical protein VJZ00_08270, partial [Thermoanaerobaculia bacterium]|nr:hypothetical protein [Thermoanaerobaculia bacterium]
TTSRSIDLSLDAGTASQQSSLYECIAIDATRLYDAGTRAFIPTDQRATDVGANLTLTWYDNADCTGTPIPAGPFASPIASATKAGAWTSLLLSNQKPPQGATHVALALRLSRTYLQGPASHVRFDDVYFVAIGDRLTIPAIASLRGDANSQWSSDIHLVNASFAPIKATLLYRCLANGPCNTKPREVSLAAGEAVLLRDAAAKFFDSPDTGGAIEIITDATGLVATSRLNSRAARGTFGAEVRALPVADFAIGTVFAGLRNGPDFRTNLGIYNPQSDRIEASMTLYVDGKDVAHTIITVQSHELVQMNAFVALGVAGLTTDNAYLRIATRFGAIAPFVSIIDNATNDVAVSNGVKQF